MDSEERIGQTHHFGGRALELELLHAWKGREVRVLPEGTRLPRPLRTDDLAFGIHAAGHDVLKGSATVRFKAGWISLHTIVILFEIDKYKHIIVYLTNTLTTHGALEDDRQIINDVTELECSET